MLSFCEAYNIWWRKPILSLRSRAPLALLVCLAFALTACAKEPPISVGRKESLVGQGLVLTVTNTSDEYLHEVRVKIVSPEGEAKELQIPTLAPHESINVGWLKLDGWPIPEGSEVTVTARGYGRPSGPWT